VIEEKPGRGEVRGYVEGGTEVQEGVGVPVRSHGEAGLLDQGVGIPRGSDRRTRGAGADRGLDRGSEGLRGDGLGLRAAGGNAEFASEEGEHGARNLSSGKHRGNGAKVTEPTASGWLLLPKNPFIPDER
jgi:hypothetical protein